MLDNNLYNLMMQMVEENQSLWRIMNKYKQDAADTNCDECLAFWDKMVLDKEEHIKELEGLIQSHMK
jgi:hypothetical protein